MLVTFLSIFLAVLAVVNVGAIFYFERNRLGFAWDIYSSIRWHMLPMTIVFLTALFVAVPFMAHVEEQLFREGVTEWRRIVPRSIAFGLVHCIVGIPLAAGLALSISGLYYGWRYKQAYAAQIAKIRGVKNWDQALDAFIVARTEAVLVSTTYHTLWNALLVGIMLFGAVLMALR